MSAVLYPSALLTQDIEDAYTCAYCDKRADVDARKRVCGHGALLCSTHLELLRRRYDAFRPKKWVRWACSDCGADLGRPPTYDHMVKVTPL